MPVLREALERLAASDVYPYHMPGHKRRARADSILERVEAYDITELPGFDDLHGSTGILRDIQARAASLYGADRTWYLVNGSTVGNLAAISAATVRSGDAMTCDSSTLASGSGAMTDGSGAMTCSNSATACDSGPIASGNSSIACRNATPCRELIMDAHCHRSSFHAAELMGLTPVYLPHREHAVFGCPLPATPETVLETLRAHSTAVAVHIVSPTYEGLLADVGGIADVAHSYGVPLIVDEAHGAYLGLHDCVPPNAARLGADLSVMSLHKTLMAPGQTALLHLTGDLIDPLRIERYLDFYETSSPSYLLMAMMEEAIEDAASAGDRFDYWVERFALMKQRLVDAGVSVLDEPASDPCKLVVAADLPPDLCPERVTDRYTIAMYTYCDTEEAYMRMERVLISDGSGLSYGY